jgi:hypothetical protein
MSMEMPGGAHPITFAVNAPNLENSMRTGAPYHFGSEPVTVSVGLPPQAGVAMAPLTFSVGMNDGKYEISMGANDSGNESDTSKDGGSDSENGGSDSEDGGNKKINCKKESNCEPDPKTAYGKDLVDALNLFEEESLEQPEQANPGAHNFVQMTCGMMQHGYTAKQAFVTACAMHQVTPGSIEYELARHMAQTM